jgi:hypothetical protein
LAKLQEKADVYGAKACKLYTRLRELDPDAPREEAPCHHQKERDRLRDEVQSLVGNPYHGALTKARSRAESAEADLAAARERVAYLETENKAHNDAATAAESDREDAIDQCVQMGNRITGLESQLAQARDGGGPKCVERWYDGARHAPRAWARQVTMHIGDAKTGRLRRMIRLSQDVLEWLASRCAAELLDDAGPWRELKEAASEYEHELNATGASNVSRLSKALAAIAKPAAEGAAVVAAEGDVEALRDRRETNAMRVNWTPEPHETALSRARIYPAAAVDELVGAAWVVESNHGRNTPAWNDLRKALAAMALAAMGGEGE